MFLACNAEELERKIRKVLSETWRNHHHHAEVWGNFGTRRSSVSWIFWKNGKNYYWHCKFQLSIISVLTFSVLTILILTIIDIFLLPERYCSFPSVWPFLRRGNWQAEDDSVEERTLVHVHYYCCSMVRRCYCCYQRDCTSCVFCVPLPAEYVVSYTPYTSLIIIFTFPIP